MKLINADKLMEDFMNTISEQSDTFDWLNMISKQPAVCEIDEEMTADINQAIVYFKDELSQMEVFSDIVSFREVERRSIETALKILQRMQDESQTGQDSSGMAAGSVRHRTDNNAVMMAAT